MDSVTSRHPIYNLGSGLGLKFRVGAGSGTGGKCPGSNVLHAPAVTLVNTRTIVVRILSVVDTDAYNYPAPGIILQ